MSDGGETTSATSGTGAVAAPERPRRRKRRAGVLRWVVRVLLVVLVLAALLAGAVELILQTDLPRRWVLSAVQEKLQLRLGAREFATGWRGRTTLSDVTAALPLAQESFLQTPRLSIKHTGILALLVTRSFKVESIEIEHPSVLVRQMSDGRWNAQEVVELIRRATGGKAADEQQQPSLAKSVPQLPSVTIDGATIRLVDRAGHEATLGPLAVHGAPDGPLVWKFDASTPEHLHVTGEIAPGGDWSHRATVSLRNLGPLVRPFLNNPSPAAVATLQHFKLAGQWSGRVAGKFQGRMDLDELFLGGYTATGPLNVSFDDGVTTIAPAGAVITPPFKDRVPPARAGGGTIAVDGHSATVKDLSLAFAGGEVRIGGSYAWDRGAGKLEAWWNKLVVPAGTTHSGSLTATLRQPWPNQPVIEADLTTDGQRGDDWWSTHLELRGSGTAWDRIGWRLTARNLDVGTGGQTYNLDGLEARLTTRPDALTLDSLSAPPGHLYGAWRRGTLAASGAYRWADGAWNAYLTGNGWPLDPKAKTPANFLVNVYGDRTWAELNELFVEGAGMQLWAGGHISYRAPGAPAELHVFGWYPPVDYTWHEAGAEPREDVRLSGRLESQLHVAGGAFGPVRLDVRGALLARDFRVKEHPLGDVTLKVNGRATNEGINLRTERLELLGGDWELTGSYTWRDRLTHVAVDLYDLSLAQLDNFAAAPPNLRGTLGGHFNVQLPEFDPQRMSVDGRYQIKDLARFNPPLPTTSPAVAAAVDAVAPGRATTRAAAPVTMPTTRATTVAGSPTAAQATRVARVSPTTVQVSVLPTTRPAATAPTTQVTLVPIADGIEGVVTGENGIVRLDPILMRRRGGRGEFKAWFPVSSPRKLHVEGNAAAWPIEPFGPAPRRTPRVLVWLQTKLDADLKRLTADGEVSLRTDIPVKDQSVTLNVRARIDGRRLDVRSLRGEGLGGDITGDGYVHLDQPLQSSGRVDLQSVDAAAITAVLPWTEGLAGKFSGTVRFSPTSREQNPDATGPFAVQGKVLSQGGEYRGMTVGDADFLVYADFRRAVLDHLKWNVAEGTVSAWARFTEYGADDRFVHVNVALDQLSLDQVARAARGPGQEHKPMPGRLSGTVIAAGDPFSEEGRKQSSGDVRLRVTESDLANSKIVNALYSVMSIKLGKPEPTGHGFLEARLEGERLEVPVVRYINRGVDVWANAAVVNVFQGGASPLEGTAAGSARPLKDLKLPFMADVDKVVAALQGGLATVDIKGTLRDPDVRVIPFASAGDAFRRFMIGEVKNEVRGTAGR